MRKQSTVAVILAAGDMGNFYKGANSAFLRVNSKKIEGYMLSIGPPKCLFKYKGEILLERQVRMLRKHGFKKIKIITNYKEHMIQDFDSKKNLQLEFIHNPDFRKPFNVLYEAMWETESCLLVFGDAYVSENAIKKLIKQNEFSIAYAYQSTLIQSPLICKIPNPLEFLITYAVVMNFWHIIPKTNRDVENLFTKAFRLYDSELGALYHLFNVKGKKSIDPDLADLDLYEMTDDYTERWGVKDVANSKGELGCRRLKEPNLELKFY